MSRDGAYFQRELVGHRKARASISNCEPGHGQIQLLVFAHGPERDYRLP